MSKVQIQGRADGITGLLNNLRIDANGALATTGGGGDSGGDIEGNCERVGISGYTDITDGTTTQRLVASTEGRLEVQVVGSNDINGGAPHRHLTIDSNGRILTIPLMTATNNKLATKTATEGGVSVQRLTTSAELIGAQQGATNLKHLLESDSTGKLLVAVGAYSDITDISTWGRCALEPNYGSLYVRSKNSTNTTWSSLTLATGNNTSSINCQDTTTIRIWGNVSTANDLQLQFAETDGSYKQIKTITPTSTGSLFSINEYFNLSPNFIRLYNDSGVSVDLGLYVEQGHD